MTDTRVKLENIILKFAIRILDLHKGKEDPTIGELIDEPADAIEALYDEKNAITRAMEE